MYESWGLSTKAELSSVIQTLLTGSLQQISCKRSSKLPKSAMAIPTPYADCEIYANIIRQSTHVYIHELANRRHVHLDAWTGMVRPDKNQT